MLSLEQLGHYRNLVNFLFGMWLDPNFKFKTEKSISNSEELHNVSSVNLQHIKVKSEIKEMEPHFSLTRSEQLQIKLNGILWIKDDILRFASGNGKHVEHQK